jgi:hypothetical protein
MANLNPAMSIGKNLIEMGFITQRDLLDVARAQVERVVWASLAATEEEPAFEAKELDASTVRLPFDTQAMLLTGVLNLVDRERVLEELGPLNQVVVLEGRRHQELSLPPDLAKLPALLDGSRTLMELSREAGVEPFRLGAFVLFLREMGWARLHELPPLDRRALELALDPVEPTVTTPPLPEPAAAAPQPSLFAEVHASQLPTTNLEHLSEVLDELGPEDELEDPVPAPETPPLEETALPIIHHEATETAEHPEAMTREAPVEPRSRRALVLLLLAAALLGGLWFGVRRLRRSRPAPPPPQVSAEPAPGAKSAAPAPEAPKATAAPSPEPAARPEAGTPKALLPQEPAPASKEPPLPSKAERLQSIRQGDWNRALAQGAVHRKTLEGRWSLRLEIACQGGTIQQAAEMLKDQDPDLFLVPMAMRDGRTCYQVFLGSFGSEAAARTAAQQLPSPFRVEGNRPKPFRVIQIPDRQ